MADRTKANPDSLGKDVFWLPDGIGPAYRGTVTRIRGSGYEIRITGLGGNNTEDSIIDVGDLCNAWAWEIELESR